MREHDISVWLYSQGALREVKSPRVGGSKLSLVFALFICRTNNYHEGISVWRHAVSCSEKDYHHTRSPWPSFRTSVPDSYDPRVPQRIQLSHSA